MKLACFYSQYSFIIHDKMEGCFYLTKMLLIVFFMILRTGTCTSICKRFVNLFMFIRPMQDFLALM